MLTRSFVFLQPWTLSKIFTILHNEDGTVMSDKHVSAQISTGLADIIDCSSSAETKLQQYWAAVCPWTRIPTSRYSDLPGELSDHTVWQSMKPWCISRQCAISFHRGQVGISSLPCQLEIGLLQLASRRSSLAHHLTPVTDLIQNAAAYLLSKLFNLH